MPRTHWVLMVMGQSTQRIIGIGVHAGVVDGMALCRLFNHAVARQRAPHYLSSDNDPLFGYQRWQANLRILDFEEIKSVPYTPTSHPFVEHLIGAIRREFLDQTLFWNSVDRESKLLAFRNYYNLKRVHSAVGGAPPDDPGARQTATQAVLSSYRWRSHCRYLYQHPAAA
jgi:transposase InsO family protein